MNNNIVRLGAGLAIVLGLAYVGNQVFNPTPGAAPAAASADVQAAGAPGARGFAVYPDRATEKELGLDYPTFNGNFVQVSVSSTCIDFEARWTAITDAK